VEDLLKPSKGMEEPYLVVLLTILMLMVTIVRSEPVLCSSCVWICIMKLILNQYDFIKLMLIYSITDLAVTVKNTQLSFRSHLTKHKLKLTNKLNL